MQHWCLMVHTSKGKVEVCLGEGIAHIIPIDAEGVAEKEPLEVYQRPDDQRPEELADLLIRHSALPEAEARWVASELLSRRAAMRPLAWRFWKREERRKAKALLEFSSS